MKDKSAKAIKKTVQSKLQRDESVTMDQVREEFAKIITPHLLKYMYEQQQVEANKSLNEKPDAKAKDI